MEQKSIVRWLALFGFVLTAVFLISQQALTQEENNATYYLPIIQTIPPDVPPLPPPLPPPVTISTDAPFDVSAIRAELEARDMLLATNKIGFHTGLGGNQTGLEEMILALDAAGIPIFLKTADNAAHIYFTQELMKKSGVPHILVYRRAATRDDDVPDYSLPPAEAAVKHWDRHLSYFPPELDPSLVWLETVNEVDKNRADWMAEFALETAKLALRDGYRWAAFGWSSGEPEPFHWESPAMLEFLRLVAEHPDQLAIALHEYSYERDEVGRWYPYLIGRFQHLFEICDRHGIPRPTVLITEWGWEYNHIPESVDQAMADVIWADKLYAAYPEVKGAAIWFLGGRFGNIHNETQRLIAPLTDYSLHTYHEVTPGIGQINTDLFAPEPQTP